MTAEPRIVVLGEALIDLVRSDGGGGLAFQGFPGGSPYNVALAAARLGVPTAFVSQLSLDFMGDLLASHLAASGVDQRWLPRSPAPTTLAFVERAAGVNRYAFHLDNCADGLWNPRPLPNLPEACRFVCHGSFSLLRGPAGPRILDLVAREADHRCIVLDPNVRPSLIDDFADFRQRYLGWLGKVHLLKLSDEDASLLAGTADIDEAMVTVARDAFDRGVRAIVLTRGDQGARLLRPGQRERVVLPPAITVADTIGAGDTLTAGLMVALDGAGVRDGETLAALDADAWERVLTLACTAAALNCTRPGADPPTRDELDAHLAGRAAR